MTIETKRFTYAELASYWVSDGADIEKVSKAIEEIKAGVFLDISVGSDFFKIIRKDDGGVTVQNWADAGQ